MSLLLCVAVAVAYRTRRSLADERKRFGAIEAEWRGEKEILIEEVARERIERRQAFECVAQTTNMNQFMVVSYNGLRNHAAMLESQLQQRGRGDSSGSLN